MSKYSCHDCSAVFYSFPQLMEHKAKEHQIQGFRCPSCHKILAGRTQTEDHLKKVHRFSNINWEAVALVDLGAEASRREREQKSPSGRGHKRAGSSLLGSSRRAKIPSLMDVMSSPPGAVPRSSPPLQ